MNRQLRWLANTFLPVLLALPLFDMSHAAAQPAKEAGFWEDLPEQTRSNLATTGDRPLPSAYRAVRVDMNGLCRLHLSTIL